MSPLSHPPGSPPKKGPTMAKAKKKQVKQKIEHPTLDEVAIDLRNDVHLFLSALNGTRGIDQRAIATEALTFAALLLRKNRDYGSSVWKPPVLSPNLSVDSAILVRMSDKVERITSLQDSDPEVWTESLEDTIRDLGAYCLLWLAKP